MGKRGPKPKRKVNIKWSPEFAYAIGLLVTDGCLSPDKRHILFVSKDREQVKNFIWCLNIINKFDTTLSGKEKSLAYRVQFSDTNFYRFLESIGLSKAKSKNISEIQIPKKYFFDYLRGAFDGDGTFYSYWDKRWKSSYMFYLEFISASRSHIEWMQKYIFVSSGMMGHITKAQKSAVYQLKYAKREALEIIKKMYYTPRVVCLTRKRDKIEKALMTEREQQKRYLFTKHAQVAKQ